MTPKYFDRHGVEQTETWAVEAYGIEFLDAGPGKKFALTEVREREGAAVVTVTVRNEHGGPQHSQPVAQSWPTLESPPSDLPLCEGSISCWSERCMFILTDAGGMAGFGFGGGAVIGGDGGPLAFWVLSPSLKSDGLAKVGWLGGTDHCGMLQLVFQITDSEPEPPDPPDPPSGQLQRVLDKAERTADELHKDGESYAAGDIYLRMADVLACLQTDEYAGRSLTVHGMQESFSPWGTPTLTRRMAQTSMLPGSDARACAQVDEGGDCCPNASK